MTQSAFISEAQRRAREAFDIDAALAALPRSSHAGPDSVSHRGHAGVRLQARPVADISDDLLREFAQGRLGAQRCSAKYLDALRVVLGNQANAERYGYMLELNQRVNFATPHVMRQIIDQMKAAGITFGKRVQLGADRRQTIQCYSRDPKPLTDKTPRNTAATALEASYRAAETMDQARQARACGTDRPQRSGTSVRSLPSSFITDEDVQFLADVPWRLAA